MDGHLSSLGGLPTIQRMVTHQRKVYYILRIWHLDLTHKTNNRGQLSWMFTDHSQDDNPPSKLWSLTIQNMATHFSKDGPQPTQGWSPTTPRMVNYHPQMVTYHSKVWSLFPGQSPPIFRMIN